MDFVSSETASSYLTSLNLAVLAATLLVVYLYRHFTILKRYGIPGPTPLPFVGNLLEILKKGNDGTDKEWLKKYGRMFGFYNGFAPHVFVSDPELMKNIMIKDFTNFMDRPMQDGVPRLFEHSLFMMRGRRWKQTRNILTPAFSAGKLKYFVPILSKNAETLVTNMTKRLGQDVEIRSFYKHFTMDCIASTAFGIDVDSQSQPNDPFVANVEPILTLSTRTKFLILLMNGLPITGKILKPLGFTRFPGKSMVFYERTGQMLIDDRKANKRSKIDFIQMLLEANLDLSKSEHIQNGISMNGHSNGHANETVEDGDHRNDGHIEKLSDIEINAQAFLFFLAGFETTASLLRYASYILAVHPDIDKKLYDEICKEVGNESPSYEQIANLTYMDMFIDEVLRFYPPVTRLQREVQKDIVVGDKTVPKGSTIIMPVWYIHHHPDYYPEPEKFIPERFSPENKASNKIDGVTYMPFGQGPRHCIGMRLALVEAKIALVHVLRKVRFVKGDKTMVPLEVTDMGLLKPKEDVYVRLEAR